MFRTIDGKKFECVRCGKCCKWGGFVFLTEEDVEEMSKALTSGDEEKFISDYTHKVGPRSGPKRMALLDKPSDDKWEECVFLEDNKCSIYENRPIQCKEYPKVYDSKCPGFKETKEVSAMSSDMARNVSKVNKKLMNGDDLEHAVLRNFYAGLKKEASSLAVASKALESGVSGFFNKSYSVKLASLDDLFAFNRVDDKHLIHKSTRDLWSIEADESGEVHITRLFESDKPIKG